MATMPRRTTLEELERDGGPDGLWEVIDGEIVDVSPAGGRQGRIGAKIGILIGNHLATQGQGQGHVYGANTGFVLRIDPLTLRAPDVAVVRMERLPPDFDDGGFLRVAPDLAVEVISPFDRSRDVLAKTIVWLDAGAALVCVVDPVSQTVTVYRPEGPPHLLTTEQALDAGDVLPGLTLPLRDIFA